MGLPPCSDGRNQATYSSGDRQSWGPALFGEAPGRARGPHPEYDSGHHGYMSSSATVLIAYFGDGPG